MNDYIATKISISPVSPEKEAGDMLSVGDASDIVAALLAENGYESFQLDGTELTAYIPEKDFSPSLPELALRNFPLYDLFTLNIVEDERIEGEDWNSEWEKNYFQPYVFGGNKCVIHSSFHKDFPECEYDIVIDPKMAFGTGHHSTTRLMVQALFDSNCEGKKILDVGTGSAILAILASKLGADTVVAVEIDEAAFVNAKDNIELNGCKNITVLHGTIDLVDTSEKFDVIVANINRNIILTDIGHYASRLSETGVLWVSGFYSSDVELIEQAAAKEGLSRFAFETDKDWAIVGFKHFA